MAAQKSNFIYNLVYKHIVSHVDTIDVRCQHNEHYHS